jgi:hypothetical protein
LAFAKAMGWDDWTPDEETEEGMVRGFRVQWQPGSEPRPRRLRRGR